MDPFKQRVTKWNGLRLISIPTKQKFEISAYQVFRINEKTPDDVRADIYLGIVVQQYNLWTQRKRVAYVEHVARFWVFHHCISGYSAAQTRESCIGHLVDREKFTILGKDKNDNKSV